MPARGRHQVREALEKFKWREDQDRAPVGVGVGKCVGDFLAVGPGPGEPLAGQRRAAAVAQQPLQAVAVPGLDASRLGQGRIYRNRRITG